MYQVDLTESYFPAQGGEPDRLDHHRRDVAGVRCHRARPSLRSRELGFDGEIGRVWTYAELSRDAERLGRAPASRHAPGARVAMYANNVAEWVLVELGWGWPC